MDNSAIVLDTVKSSPRYIAILQLLILQGYSWGVVIFACLFCFVFAFMRLIDWAWTCSQYRGSLCVLGHKLWSSGRAACGARPEQELFEPLCSQFSSFASVMMAHMIRFSAASRWLQAGQKMTWESKISRLAGNIFYLITNWSFFTWFELSSGVKWEYLKILYFFPSPKIGKLFISFIISLWKA